MHLTKTIIILAVFILELHANKIVISTYNLWNIMFNWEIRKLRISKMIKSSNPDVIAFQEVRCSDDKTEDQIKELQNLLPSYKWIFFKSLNRVQKTRNSVHKEYSKEGIGILSKLPVQSFYTEELPYKYGPDTNKRLLLHIKVLHGDHYVNIINVHFSYDRQQQCGNAAAVLDYIFKKRLRNVIILGDFNTYNEFEAPIDLITFKKGQMIDGCKKEHRDIGRRSLYFDDFWKKIYNQNEQGLTFSNMPTPGLESRPDRIITSTDIDVESGSLLGYGTTYKEQYSSSIKLHRLKTVLQHAALSYRSVTGHSCLYDCGPHGSCRCGICVAVGNENVCELPNCVECNASIYQYYVSLMCIAIFGIMHLFYAILSILITASNFRGESVFSVLGFKCCLFNPDLYKKSISITRRSNLTKICRRWPLFRLPPCYLLLISFILVVIVIFSSKYIFVDTLKTVNSILDEEFYPSDHLMLTAKLKYSES